MDIMTVKLPEKLQRELSAAAAARGVTKSQLVRQAVAEYMGRLGSQRKGAVSALALAGDLVGSIGRAPPDLASNRKYMDDYGKD